MDAKELLALVRRLTALPKETEWVEFKENYADPDKVGEYISALSNSAALHGESTAFIVWGIRDGTHEIVGTTFQPHQEKKGQEELEGYLARNLTPRINFKIHEGDSAGKRLIVF